MFVLVDVKVGGIVGIIVLGLVEIKCLVSLMNLEWRWCILWYCVVLKVGKFVFFL